MQTKINSPYHGCHEVQSALLEFFFSLDKSRIWWYNIIGYNKGSTSHLLRLDPITVGSTLFTVKLVAPRQENSEPISTVKRTELRKFIDYFGRSIEADPSKAGKKKIYFGYSGYIPRHSSAKLHISRHHIVKYFNL